jgi:hypothetical protein
MKINYNLIIKALLLIVCFSTQQLEAQAPQKMSYQAVIRNTSNVLVTSTAVGMRISILQGSASGPSVYTETQSLTTNANGLVSLEIGTGTVVSGTFSAINWATGPYFIKTETDPTGGSSYTIFGTTQLTSVPYALFSATSGSGETPGTAVGDMKYWNGTAWVMIPVGSPNQVLKLSSSSIPQWQTESSNGGKTYIIIQGAVTDSQASAQLANELGSNTQFIWVQNTTSLTTLNLGSVTDLIEIKINNNSALTSVNLSGITNVLNLTDVSSNASLTSLSMPVLNDGGNISISNNALLNSISLPALTKSGSFSCNGNAALSSLFLPALTTTSSNFSCTSNAVLTSLSLPLFTSTFMFTCSSNAAMTSLSLATYTSNNGSFTCSGNPALTSLSLPALTSNNGQFYCNSNAALSSVNLSSLTTNNDFELWDNASITSLTLPSLSILGYFVCFQNSSLNSLNLPSLSIMNNPQFVCSSNAFPSSQVNALLAQIVAIGSSTLNYIRLDLQSPPAPPTGTGITDKAFLIGLGKTVLTD